MGFVYFIVFGFIFYLQSSLWESLFHEYVLDVRPRNRFNRFRRSRLLTGLWYGSFSHGTMHHYLTFRGNYLLQFSNSTEKNALVEWLKARLTLSQLQNAIAADFGNSLTWLSTRICGLPIYLNMLWLLVASRPSEALAMTLANFIFATPYILFSKYVHPYLHQAYDTAIARASLPIKLLLRSRYGLAMRVSHFVHHRHPTMNFNLQIGFDILRRRWLEPTEMEWTEMLRIGLIHAAHRKLLQSHPILGHGFGSAALIGKLRS